MTVDLAAISGQARAVAEQLIDSSGTTVSIARGTEGKGQGTTDRDSLIYTPELPDVLVDETPAFLAALGTGSASVAGPDTTATPVQVGTMILLLRPDVIDVQEQDEITVVSCLDERLTGRVLDVVSVLDSSPGALRVLHCLPRSSGPGAS